MRTSRDEPRFPDIVLVDRTRDRTLLLIEVKIHARLSDLRGGLRDVVDQVLEYRDLVAAKDAAWTVRPVIVAAQVNDNVVQRARDAEVDVWRFDRAHTALQRSLRRVRLTCRARTAPYTGVQRSCRATLPRSLMRCRRVAGSAGERSRVLSGSRTRRLIRCRCSGSSAPKIDPPEGCEQQRPPRSIQCPLE